MLRISVPGSMPVCSTGSKPVYWPCARCSIITAQAVNFFVSVTHFFQVGSQALYPWMSKFTHKLRTNACPSLLTSSVPMEDQVHSQSLHLWIAKYVCPTFSCNPTDLLFCMIVTYDCLRVIGAVLTRLIEP